jgi:hypothetical protein
MATLSGQSIQNTYDGLLKLADSTTGITSTLQAIEDGLGNNTGARIATNQFTAPNVYGMYHNNLKPQYMGTGFLPTGTYTPGAGSQGQLIFGYFYDTGVHSYSAVTVNVTTQTSTSDTLELLFYDLQFVNDYGAFPRNQIMSGITLDTTPTGLRTTVLPSTLSFSGQGGGFYAFVLKYGNAGNVTPTVRYATAAQQNFNPNAYLLGNVRNSANTGLIVANRAQTYAGSTGYWFSTQATPATITEADVASRFSTTVIAGQFGFALHTIK